MFLEDLEHDEKIIICNALKKCADNLELEDVYLFSNLMVFYLIEGENDV